MALTTSLLETNIGIPVADTYARITMMRSTKEETLLLVNYYATASARDVNALPVLERTFNARTEELQPGDNPLAIGYAWLKTQSEFADAVDC